jgi:hypothetical protein
VRGRLVIGLAAALAASLPARAGDFALFPSGTLPDFSGSSRDLGLDLAGCPAPCFDGNGRPEEFRLDLSVPFRTAFPDLPHGEPAGPTARAAPSRPLLSGRTLWMTVGVFAAIPVVGEIVWWKGNERGSFHFENEGWFGRDTYAGGADKASHIFFGYMASREMSKWYERFGNTPAQSRALAVGVATLGGALIELGDGFTEVYGYSWQDVAANFTGALAAAGIGAARIDDLVGLRFGFVSAEIPPPCCRAFGYGHDYSEDVYSLDLKIAGALRRAGLRPGVARFFLLSFTYGSKGYRFSPEEVRQRNVGIDLGINMPEVLQAIGVRREKWWGEILYTVFDYIRFPYTAFGFQYDLNHHEWHGPSTGDKFDPGRVIYP